MEHATQPVHALQTQSLTHSSPNAFTVPGNAAVPLSDVADPSLLTLLLESDEATDPRAEGACRLDLTVAEWRLVRGAPLVGFLWVAGADGQVLPAERRALLRALEEGQRAPSETFQAVCRELHRQPDQLMARLVSTSALGCEQLSEAYHLVHRKLGAAEAERFKLSLLKLGRQVALASAGLLSSLGWMRGTERRALAELAVALDPSYT